MKIKMVGNYGGSAFSTARQVKGKSGKKYHFFKRPKEGMVYETESIDEIEDILMSQLIDPKNRFIPVLESLKNNSSSVEIEGLELEGLKELCKNLGIETMPQDKERSLKRLLSAYNLGAKS